MTNVLTQLPFGKIQSFIQKNFKNINFSEDATKFFEESYLGNTDNDLDLIKLRDGIPEEVNQWLIDEFDIDMKLSGEYAIAAVLAIVLEFEKRAYFDTFTKGGVEYANGYHKNITMRHGEFKKQKIEAYKLNIKTPDFTMFASKTKIEADDFDKAVKQVPSKNIHLSIPLAKCEEVIDMTETFKGTHMIKKSDNQRYDISSAKTLTQLDLGLDKVEIKQVAAVCMVTASCSAPDLTPQIRIDDDFYLYVQYKNELIFGMRVDKAAFIQGEALAKMKTEENDSIENSFETLKKQLKQNH